MASDFRTVAGEHCITRAMWRNYAPSSVIRWHCSACPGANGGDRPTRFSPARALSYLNLIRSLADST